jgi:hypothetical protein
MSHSTQKMESVVTQGVVYKTKQREHSPEEDQHLDMPQSSNIPQGYDCFPLTFFATECIFALHLRQRFEGFCRIVGWGCAGTATAKTPQQKKDNRS